MKILSKTVTRLMLCLGLGVSLLAGCVPVYTYDVRVDDNRPRQRKVRVITPGSGFRIQSNPAQIKIKKIPPGHLKQQQRGKGHGKGHGRGRGRGR